MVKRAALLGDPFGLAAHLDDEGFGGQPQLGARGDPEGAPGEPLDVHRSAGERHGGVQGQRQRAGPQSGVQDLRAVPPRGVHEQLAGSNGAGLGEPLHQAGQGVVRDGQQDQFGALHDLGGRYDGHVREQLGGPADGGVGDRGDGHRTVPGELQGRGQRGAHATGADHADGEPGGTVPGIWLLECTHSTAAFPFQSARGTGRCTGRFLVMLTRSVRGASGCPQAVGARTPSAHGVHGNPRDRPIPRAA